MAAKGTRDRSGARGEAMTRSEASIFLASILIAFPSDGLEGSVEIILYRLGSYAFRSLMRPCRHPLGYSKQKRVVV